MTESGAKIISILAFTHVVSLGLERLQTETDFPLGFERQQMLGIPPNTLESIICHFGAKRSPYVQRFAETGHGQHVTELHLEFKSNTPFGFKGVDWLVALKM